MIFRFRVILDTQEDVFRDFEIESTASLEDFHYAIAQAFGFGGTEMATFYRSSAQWEQGEELPLIDMGEGAGAFGEKELGEFFDADHHHMIYVYDFLHMWTFFVELMEIGEATPTGLYPNLVFAQGEVPEQAPETQFEAEENDSMDTFDEANEDDGLLDYDDADFY